MCTTLHQYAYDIGKNRTNYKILWRKKYVQVKENAEQLHALDDVKKKKLQIQNCNAQKKHKQVKWREENTSNTDKLLHIQGIIHTWTWSA